MSPRNLGGKYISRQYPWSRKCACHFLRDKKAGETELRHLCGDSWRRWSCGVFESWISVVHYTIRTNQNGMSYTTMIDSCFRWWMLDFVQAGVRSCCLPRSPSCNNGSDKVIKIRLNDFAKFHSTGVSNLVRWWRATKYQFIFYMIF